MNRRPFSARPFLLPAVLVLLAGLWAGLVRMGWRWPALHPQLAGWHGPLMIAGFFGTLISLERAVALQRRWPYLAPALNGLGGLALVFGLDERVGMALLLAGSAFFLLMYLPMLRQHMAPFTLILAVGTGALVGGNFLWLAGWPISRLAPWWMAFLVLTIAAERLELGRLRRLPRRVVSGFMVGIGMTLAGLGALFFSPALAMRLIGLGFVALALWLLRYDVARRTIHKPGLPRYAAACLLSGYVWLGAGGVLMIWVGFVPAGFLYDAMLHAVLVGFVFAMTFGHAPIIFPAVLNLPIVFSPRLYIPLAALHLSLILRVAGDFWANVQVRQWGGLLNALTIVYFLVLMADTMLASIAPGARRKPTNPSRN